MKAALPGWSSVPTMPPEAHSPLESRLSSRPAPKPTSRSGVYEKALDRVGGLLAPEGELSQLLFVSRLARTPTPSELVDLVVEARASNAQQRVTGVLLHKSGAFLHALEGRNTSVIDVYQRFLLNPRHAVVTALSDKPIQQRQYRPLALSFHDLDELEECGSPSVRSFTSIPLSITSLTANPARAAQLLLAIQARG